MERDDCFAALVFAASPLCALAFKLLKPPSYVDYVRQRLGPMDAILVVVSDVVYFLLKKDVNYPDNIHIP